MLVLTGVLAHFYVQNAMLGELEEQIGAEEVMLEDIYREQGSVGLISTLDDLEGTVVRGHVLGLFDENGAKMAGNVGVAPDFVGWSQKPLTITHSWAPKGDRRTRPVCFTSITTGSAI